MKKLVLLLGLLGFVWASSAMGAECTGCVGSRKVYKNGDVTVSVLVTSDGSACTCTLDTDDYENDLLGQYLYTVEVVPGTGSVAPDAAFDLDVEDDNAFHMVDTDSNSHTTTTWNPGNGTLGQYPKVRTGIVLELGDMGTAGDQATIHLVGAQ